MSEQVENIDLFVDLLRSDQNILARIAIAVAKVSPSVFLEAGQHILSEGHAKKLIDLETRKKHDAAYLMFKEYNENKISSIKEMRSRYGIGLKEAKDLVDNAEVHHMIPGIDRLM